MSIGSDIKGFFVGLWHLLKPEEQSMLQAFEAKVTPEILAAARDGITAAVDAGLHDTAARDAAIVKAEADLKAAGSDAVALAKSEWNALIELLYTAQKAPATPVAAEPVAEEPTPTTEAPVEEPAPAATEPVATDEPSA